MVLTPLLTKSKFEYLELPTQIDGSDDPSVNHALTHVARMVMEVLQHIYPVQVDSNGPIQTTSIRAIEPKYKHLILIEPLSPRELEVLQLIVEGDRNPMIAQKLYIAEGTVKTHVRNILKKLCVKDRTQAAICALRAGLVH